MVDVAVGVLSVLGDEPAPAEILFALIDHIGVAAEEDMTPLRRER